MFKFGRQKEKKSWNEKKLYNMISAPIVVSHKEKSFATGSLRITSRNPASSILADGIELQSLSVVIKLNDSGHNVE